MAKPVVVRSPYPASRPLRLPGNGPLREVRLRAAVLGMRCGDSCWVTGGETFGHYWDEFDAAPAALRAPGPSGDQRGVGVVEGAAAADGPAPAPGASKRTRRVAKREG